MYTLIEERLPIPHQTVEVQLKDGSVTTAYKSAWGNAFYEATTGKALPDVQGWKVQLRRNMVNESPFVS